MIMERYEEFRDLGVVFDKKIFFEKHFSHIVPAPCKLLGYVTRNWRGCLDINTMKLVSITFTR